MRKYAFNPYLPSWEYIPDGEPYVFGDRVYVYGSHDMYNGHVFCLGDYVCWSAPVSDLGNWRYEGVIYLKTQDPMNKDGRMCLYAPDVTKGPDGRYYLYYVLDRVSVVSVAVSDRPEGPYDFYGYVRDTSGKRIGDRPGDEHQFDPGVLTEGDKTYLYTGFCPKGDTTRHGSMGMVLDKDMLTVIEEPVFIIPSASYSEGTGFEGHEFFEASSIRKKGDLYYFVYSSIAMHELCYAVSDNPLSGFTYGGVIVSNCDIGIDSYKPKEMSASYGSNNHGSIVEINGEWYIFYHRHTNNTSFSRQGCAEKLRFDGTRIIQAELTSCGLNGGPLPGKGEYPSYIACNMFTNINKMYVGGLDHPYIMQDGRDGDTDPAYITGICDSSTIGFKYFDFNNVRAVAVKTRAYGDGVLEIRTKWDGECLGRIKINNSNIWEEWTADVAIPDGVSAVYLKFVGSGAFDLLSIRFA